MGPKRQGTETHRGGWGDQVPTLAGLDVVVLLSTLPIAIAKQGGDFGGLMIEPRLVT